MTQLGVVVIGRNEGDRLRNCLESVVGNIVATVDRSRQATPTDWAVHFRDVDGHLLSLFGPEGKA